MSSCRHLVTRRHHAFDTSGSHPLAFPLKGTLSSFFFSFHFTLLLTQTGLLKMYRASGMFEPKTKGRTTTIVLLILLVCFLLIAVLVKQYLETDSKSSERNWTCKWSSQSKSTTGTVYSYKPHASEEELTRGDGTVDLTQLSLIKFYTNNNYKPSGTPPKNNTFPVVEFR
jgi:hypothetical protein